MKHLMLLAASLSLLISLPTTAAGIAAAGQGKSGTCAACHGADGNSSVANWPKLAGQHATYLQRQLVLIKNGSRQVPEMAVFVASLSDQDMADLAAYYASQSVTAGLADAGLQAAGELMFRAGNSVTEIPACMSCHGPAGKGNPLSGYPALAGQHAAYTEKMLTRYRSGQTWGEEDAGSKIMTGVALRLTDSEIKAVSSYIQGLHAVNSQAD